MAQLNDLLVMGQSTLLGPVNVTGTVTITNATDADVSANNGPALIVGGAVTSTHIEIDCNEVLAKSDGTTETDLYLGTTTSKVHIGQDDKGNASKPVYLSGGVITACSSTKGGTAQPVYLNSGAITACTSTVGSTAQPVYMSSGTITACSDTVGSATKPAYMSAGTITEGSTYAGGTKVTLNGTNAGGSTASFYAPTSAGTSGQVLKSNGSGAPTWGTISTTDKYVEQTDYSSSTKESPVLICNASSGNCGTAGFTPSVKIKYDEGKLTASKFNATSDRRLKEHLISYTPQKSILDLPIYKFDFINGAKNQIGCMAQDLKEICPEIVEANSDGYLSIQESKIIYLLIDEIKKLKTRIEQMEDK